MNVPAPLVPAPVVAVAQPAGRLPVAFGPRFFVWLLAGLVWLVPAWMDPRFLMAMAVWDAVLLVVWVWDVRQLPRPQQLEIGRRWAAPAALDVGGGIDLEVHNHSDIPLRVLCLDEVPHGLREEPPAIHVAVPARSKASGRYQVQPRERGANRLGSVYLRYRGQLGLAERWATASLTQDVIVYPNLQEARRHTIYLIRARQIELEKRHTRRRGRGAEFDSLRESREGDEWRDISWTATARHGRLIAREYRIERSQTVWIVIDAGRLLRARVGTLTKLDHSVNAGLSMAHLALASGDRVGLLAYGRGAQQRLAAATGARHLRAVVDALAHVRGETAEANHGLAANTLLAAQRRRSLVVWITDLAETFAVPDVIEQVSPLLKRHLLLFVAIGHQELHQMAEALPEDVAGMYHQAAAQEVQQRRGLLLRTLRAQGALTLDVLPGQMSGAIVNQYLEIKDRGLI